MSFLGRRCDFHFSLWSRDNDTVLVQSGGHWIGVQNRSDAVDVCCIYILDIYEYSQTKNLPLLALDSDTLDDPGSAELQYNVLV